MFDMTSRPEVKRLTAILSAHGRPFTIEDIQELMDEELEKSPEEMDTEAIDLCASILGMGVPDEPYFTVEEIKKVFEEIDAQAAAEGWNPEDPIDDFEEEKPTKFKKTAKVKVSRILWAAAMLSFIFAIGIPVSAKIFDTGASDKVLEFYKDHFRIDLRMDDEAKAAVSSEGDILDKLIEDSMGSLTLPEVLRSEDYKKTYEIEQDEYITTICVYLKNPIENITGNIMVTQYKDSSKIAKDYTNISDMYDNFKMISLGNMNIVIFGDKEKSYIRYIDGAEDYCIALNCDFETAVSIADSIK